MPSHKKNTQYFDDDFEVTYEEEIPFHYNTSNVDLNTDSVTPYYADDFEDAYDDDRYEEDYDDAYNDPYDEDYDDAYDDPYDDEYEDDYDDDYDDRYDDRYDRNNDRDYDRYGDNRYDDRRDRKYRDSSSRTVSGTRRRKKRRRSYRPTRLAAPIQKGGNTLLRIVQSIVRNLSALLILAIIGLMAYTFLRGSAPYGDLKQEISSNNYTIRLASYIAVAAFFILYELCSMLWTMTRVRVRDSYGTYKEDVGRGLFSFIFIYICSYASFLVNEWIPEIHDILIGLKGALDVFGSMHNALFGLCLAGVISCLFRKYSLSL